jgi:hypothetical protein
MTKVFEKQQWNPTELKIINCCRFYLQVELLSDIITGDGRSIQRHIWKGKKDQCHENFTKIFFEQPRPGETSWSIWRKILKTILDCNDYGTFGRQQFQIESSGDWK